MCVAFFIKSSELSRWTCLKASNQKVDPELVGALVRSCETFDPVVCVYPVCRRVVVCIIVYTLLYFKRKRNKSLVLKIGNSQELCGSH